MKVSLVLALVLIANIALTAQMAAAQEHQTWIAGAGFGGALGVNEAITKPLGLAVRAEAVAFNSIVPGVSPEFGLSFFTVRSHEPNPANDYRTQLLAPDLRFRFSPRTTPLWFPYFFAGGGMAIFNVLQWPAATSPAAHLSDAVPFFTFGLGISHQITEQIGFDLNAGAALALTDDINPLHDGRNDGWWSGIASLYWIF